MSRVKQATVAIAAVLDPPPSNRKQIPFVIIGTGFCIDQSGIIVTCEHVVAPFIPESTRKTILESGADNPASGLRLTQPHVLFFDTQSSDRKMLVHSAGMTGILGCMDQDVALIRLTASDSFPNGFPSVEIEPYENIHEGMEIATCGFPMGNRLMDQTGIRTSSFTRGILSSIAPTPVVSQERVKGFQLNIVATHGNSGGPVFSWESGNVFGILRGGPTLPDGETLPGIAIADPIYFIFQSGMIEQIGIENP